MAPAAVTTRIATHNTEMDMAIDTMATVVTTDTVVPLAVHDRDTIQTACNPIQAGTATIMGGTACIPRKAISSHATL